MHPENLGPLPPIGLGNGNLAIEPSRAEQGRVEHVRAIGGAHDHHALVGVKPVHLDEQLIQGIVALVGPAPHLPASPRAANCVHLVDEDDTGRLLLRLLEEIADPARPNAHEHFHEVRPGNGEKGHSRLAGHGFCHERFARAGRTDQQDSRRQRPPSRVNFSGRFRNSTTSATSSFGSSNPATSSNVTRSAASSSSSVAVLSPRSELRPPAVILRMKKNQIPTISPRGSPQSSRVSIHSSSWIAVKVTARPFVSVAA